MKKKKILAIILVGALALSSLVGCATTKDKVEQTDDTAKKEAILAKELLQNDYRGGVKRSLAIKEQVIAVMQNMKANNEKVRSDTPNSFWTAEGYQDFVTTFLDIAIINDTQWFNEEQTTWEQVVEQISKTENSFTIKQDDGYMLMSGVEIKRNEKDDYSVTGIMTNLASEVTSNTLAGKTSYRVLFDCDKDWCKATAVTSFTEALNPVTSQLYEYQRVNVDTFAIQTSKERLVVVFEKAEADVDIRERKVKEFYYSKLVKDGNRTTFVPYEPLPEQSTSNSILIENIRKNELMAGYPQYNEKGDIASQYGETESMFFKSIQGKPLTDWVFEDNALQQAIVYKDGVLVVTTYNKLSKNYEKFIYSMKDAKGNKSELENIVEIENLVGLNNTKAVKIEKEVAPVINPTVTDAVVEETAEPEEQEPVEETEE